jgi:hypothetical protein
MRLPMRSSLALGASSKFNVEPEFIDMLFEKGREAAENWLHTSFRHVGVSAHRRSPQDVPGRGRCA